ncbi:MAG: glycosyltransferase family 39 protein [Sumerlaeia bacterium]
MSSLSPAEAEPAPASEPTATLDSPPVSDSPFRPMPPAVAARPVTVWEWVGLGFLLFVAAGFRLYDPDLSFFSAHTSRDLYRSLEILRGVQFHLLGSEMQYGGRVMGPFMYLLVAPILAISPRPEAIQIFVGLLNTGVVAATWYLVRRYLGPMMAFWTAAIYAVFPLEVIQLRYNWNPCFLPPMMTLALWGLLRAAIDRRGWWVVLCVLGLSLGLQLHLSAIEALPAVIGVLAVARARIGWKPWAATAALVLVLFSPLIISEVSTSGHNTAEMVEAPVSLREDADKWKFNPNGPLNYLYHTHLEMNEEITRLGFVALMTMPMKGEEVLGDERFTAARIINGYADIQIVFWAAGMACLLFWVIDHARRRKGLEGALFEASRARMLFALAVLLWQAGPVAVLSFFNFHGVPGVEEYSIVPLRYYLVTYPAPFITTGAGIVALGAGLGWLYRKIEGRSGADAKAYGLVYVLAALLFVGYGFYSAFHLRLIEKSGRIFVYDHKAENVVPNLRTMREVADILLDNAGIDKAAWYERVHTQNLLNLRYGETTLDWIISQDPRSVTNDPPDPRMRWLLHSPIAGPPEPGLPPGSAEQPVLPPGARKVATWRLKDEDITIIQYRVEDPENTPVPNNRGMRNYYYRHVRMRYLGPDAEVRAADPEATPERIEAYREAMRRSWIDWEVYE